LPVILAYFRGLLCETGNVSWSVSAIYDSEKSAVHISESILVLNTQGYNRRDMVWGGVE
jgi:hypothetical protein